jgi:hypothetical protein
MAELKVIFKIFGHSMSDQTKTAIILRRLVTYRLVDWTAIATVIPVLEGRPLAAHQREDFESEARTAAEAFGVEALITFGYLPRSAATHGR